MMHFPPNSHPTLDDVAKKSNERPGAVRLEHRRLFPKVPLGGPKTELPPILAGTLVDHMGWLGGSTTPTTIMARIRSRPEAMTSTSTTSSSDADLPAILDAGCLCLGA